MRLQDSGEQLAALRREALKKQSDPYSPQCTAASRLQVSVMLQTTLSSSPNFMNLTFYSRSFSVLGLPSEVPSLKITQSFIMGMHSSIVAGVKLETLITYRCIPPAPPLKNAS